MTTTPVPRPSQATAPDAQWTAEDLRLAWARGDHDAIVAAEAAGQFAQLRAGQARNSRSVRMGDLTRPPEPDAITDTRARIAAARAASHPTA